jgi:hypothetical protein
MARPILKKGMSGKKGTDVGEAILLWRMFLGKPELKPAAGVTSYDFGAATDKATKEWQSSVGLAPTGVVDAKTWAVYDGRIAVAPPAVQAAAHAAEATGEAKKAAVMAAAVAKPAAAKPAAAKSQTPAVQTPVAPASAPAAIKAKAQEVAAQAKTVASNTVAKVKAHSDGMSGWKRALSVGLLGLAGLVGYKAIKKP